MPVLKRLGVSPGDFAEMIRAFRKKGGLTQEELADFLGGVSVSIVVKWEAGRHVPRSKTIVNKLVTMGVIPGEAIR